VPEERPEEGDDDDDDDDDDDEPLDLLLLDPHELVNELSRALPRRRLDVLRRDRGRGHRRGTAGRRDPELDRGLLAVRRTFSAPAAQCNEIVLIGGRQSADVNRLGDSLSAKKE